MIAAGRRNNGNHLKFQEAAARTGRDDNAKVLFVSATQTAPLRTMVSDIYPAGRGAMGIIMTGTGGLALTPVTRKRGS